MNLNLKNRQQLLVILAAVAIGLFLMDRVVLATLTNTWKRRAARIAELREKCDHGRSLLRREAGLRSRWDYMRTNTLSSDRSAAEQQLLRGFDRWSSLSRVSILSITPQWKQDSEDFRTLECRVEASGSLDTLSRFLFEIEKDPLALKLQAVELSSRDNEGRQLALGVQVSGLVLTPRRGAVADSGVLARREPTTRN
jgi:hypothetical protein